MTVNLHKMNEEEIIKSFETGKEAQDYMKANYAFSEDDVYYHFAPDMMTIVTLTYKKLGLQLRAV